MDIQPLETDRLLLRGWRAEDAAPYIAFYDDAENAEFVGGKRTPDQAWRSLALMVGHWDLKGFGYFAVEERGTGAFVGCIGLWKSEGWPEHELGYWVVRAHQGKGYAREAAERCLRYAREVVRPPSLVSYIDPANEPSKALARSLGAQPDGVVELDVHGPHEVWRHFGAARDSVVTDSAGPT